MSLSTAKLEATYYNGKFPLARNTRLVFGDNQVTLTGEDIALAFDFDQLRVSPRTGHADRFIALPDGAQCQCADHPVLDGLPQEVRSEGPVAWLENRVPVAVASVAIIIFTLIF